MNWLFPGFLAGALAVGVPIGLHLLRRSAQTPVVFPSLMFLRKGSKRTERRAQRLQRWLVLLFRCAVFLLLAAGFARPFRSGMLQRQPTAVIALVDNSFSMQAGNRWSQSIAALKDRLSSLENGDKLGVMLMAPQPTWLSRPTDNTAEALRVIDGLEPGWLTAKVEPALRVAAETLAEIPAGRREIFVVSDHQRVSWAGTDFARKLPAAIEVEFPALPPAVKTQAALSSPVIARAEEGLLATVVVHNFTGAQKRVLRVFHDGTAMVVREAILELKAQETRKVELHLAVSSDHEAYFRFALDPDDLAADDTVYAVWQPEGDGELLLDATSPGDRADFLATALAATAKLQPKFQVEAAATAQWPARPLIVLRNDNSFSVVGRAQLDTSLGEGGAALVFATGGPEQQNWLASHGVQLAPLAERSEPWRVQDWDTNHPLVEELGRRRLEVLLGWQFRRGWAVNTPGSSALAAWADRNAAIVEMRIGAGTVILCGFAPDRQFGDWPATPSFVPFVHQTIAYLFRLTQSVLVEGQTGLPLRLSGGVGEWRALDGPVSHQEKATVSGSVVPMVPGVYKFTQNSEVKRFAVNLPREESDPDPWTAGTPWLELISHERAIANKSETVAMAAADAEQKSPFWWWVIAGAALFMMTEGLLANRTAR